MPVAVPQHFSPFEHSVISLPASNLTTDMQELPVRAKRPDEGVTDAPEQLFKKHKLDQDSTQWNGQMGEEQQRAPCEEELRREARVRRTEHLLRDRVRTVLDRGYTNLTIQELEDMVTVAVMDYFVNYHPCSHIFRRISQLESIVEKCEEKYLHTAKQLSDAKFLLKRLTEMRIERYKSGTEAPYKLIRSVAVQAGARRCRGGDLCSSIGLPRPNPSPQVVEKKHASSAVSGKVGDVSLLSAETSPSPALGTSSAVPSPPTPNSSFVIDLTDKDEEMRAGLRQLQVKPSDSKQSDTPTRGAQTTEARTRSQMAERVGTGQTRPAAPVATQLTEPPKRQPMARKATSMRVVRGGTGISPIRPPVPSESNLIPLSDIRSLTNKQPEKVTLPPLPPAPKYPEGVVKPPTPVLKVNKAAENGIMLSWNVKSHGPDTEASMDFYQVFACQECGGPSSGREWSNVGDVRALPLPMACTLSQFREGHRYHFVVRAVNKKNVVGDFSHPASIRLLQKLTNGMAPSHPSVPNTATAPTSLHDLTSSPLR